MGTIVEKFSWVLKSYGSGLPETSDFAATLGYLLLILKTQEVP
jgi:hypothetical protein